MKINFSKKEYRQLLDLVFMGDWVASGMNEDGVSPYDEIREKIYSYAKEMGCEELIEFDRTLGKHFETAQFEESGVMELIDNYNHHIVHELDEM